MKCGIRHNFIWVFIVCQEINNHHKDMIRSSSDKAYISLVDIITKAQFSNSPNDFKICLFG